MKKLLYTFYFENGDIVSVLAFCYTEAVILAKAHQIQNGRPYFWIEKCKITKDY